MFITFVAICLAATPVQECQKETALDWIVAPERHESMSGCFQHGVHYAAQSRLVKPDTYPKIFCRSPGGPAAVAQESGGEK